MKQKMFLAALLLWAASSVCAQTESRSTEERTDTDVRNNWFVSVAEIDRRADRHGCAQ